MADTGAKCPTCKGAIMGGVSHEPLHSRYDMPYGPISENNYRLVVWFSCAGCGAKFDHLPSKPDSAKKLLEEERNRIAEVQRKW
jgi:DNA-directed RNA polymerase subunit RPC12/RpoP